MHLENYSWNVSPCTAVGSSLWNIKAFDSCPCDLHSKDVSYRWTGYLERAVSKEISSILISFYIIMKKTIRKSSTWFQTYRFGICWFLVNNSKWTIIKALAFAQIWKGMYNIATGSHMHSLWYFSNRIGSCAEDFWINLKRKPMFPLLCELLLLLIDERNPQYVIQKAVLWFSLYCISCDLIFLSS